MILFAAGSQYVDARGLGVHFLLLAANLGLQHAESLHLNFSGCFGLKFSRQRTNELFGSEQDDLFLSSFQLGANLSWREPSAGRIGGFPAFGIGDHDNDSTPSADCSAVGGEAQLDIMTFYVQGGFLDLQAYGQKD